MKTGLIGALIGGILVPLGLFGADAAYTYLQELSGLPRQQFFMLFITVLTGAGMGFIFGLGRHKKERDT